MLQKFYVIKFENKFYLYNEKKYNEFKQNNNIKKIKSKSFTSKEKALKYFKVKINNKNNLNAFFENIDDSFFDVVSYTDGSYSKIKNVFTYGAVLFFKNKKIEFFEKFNNKKWLKLENASGEIMGAIKVIDFCLKNNIKFLVIYSDYKNLILWKDKNNNNHNKEINKYNQYINEITKNNLFIVFKWVKSHSENKYNDLADYLANEAYNLNYFSQVYLK